MLLGYAVHTKAAQPEMLLGYAVHTKAAQPEMLLGYAVYTKAAQPEMLLGYAVHTKAAQPEMLLGYAVRTNSAARDAGITRRRYQKMSTYITDNMCACLPTNIAWLHNTHTNTNTHTYIRAVSKMTHHTRPSCDST